MIRALRCLAVLLPAVLLAGCTGLFFHPSRTEVLSPEKLKLDYEDVWIPTQDGVRLHGWYLRAQGPARGTLLHLHGNAENISTFIAAVWWLPARGYNVLLLDYRGYGRSEGTAEVHGLHRDAAAGLRYLVERGGVDRERLILFGQSLGGSVALHTAAHAPGREHLRGVIVEGAFAGYRRIARDKMSLLWLTRYLRGALQYLFDDDYSAERSVALLAPLPLLVIHGERDQVVSPEHGQRLYDLAGEPRQLWRLPDVGHVESLTRPELRERFLEYLDALPPRVTRLPVPAAASEAK